MADREKVISGLESLRAICNAKSDMAIGNGKVAWAGYANTADDALALMKEQEPKRVIPGYNGVYCPSCSSISERMVGLKKLSKEMSFCPYCGQAVKWDETD